MDDDAPGGAEGGAGADGEAAGDGAARLTFEELGDADGGPSLRLDYRRFAYAGKFVMSTTGKAVARADAAVIAAASFDRDRTDASVVRIRYVTVRRDRRGEGVGARLLAFLAERRLSSGARAVRIAVNNPFAYEAAYKAEFGYTGERTGLAELICARPGDRSPAAYRSGLAAFDAREDLGDAERRFLDGRRDGEPPAVVSSQRRA